MRRKNSAFIFLILVILSCSAQKQEEKKVIVTVGSGELTLGMLKQEIPTFLRSAVTKEQINNFIQQWIDTELIYQNSLKMGMDIDPGFRYELEKAKKELLVRKYLDRVLNDEAGVTEEEILEYYKDNKEKFVTNNEEIKALQILVSTRAEANTVSQRLKNGEDFVKVAREVSLDYTKQKRVELEFFSRSDVVPEVAAIIFRYKAGSVVKPIKSDFGWHIFKILEKRPKGFHKELKEVRENIVSRLASSKSAQRYKSLIKDLGNKMRIKTNENIIKEIYKDSTLISKN